MDQRYVILQRLQGDKGMFYERNHPNRDQTKLPSGKTAFKIVKYADTEAQCQLYVFGKVITTADSLWDHIKKTV